MLEKDSTDHYLLTVVGSSYNEIGQHEIALDYSNQALEFDPNCPLVLWDYACALDLSGNDKLAIKIWEKIVKLGVDGLNNNECSEGLQWAKSLVLDSHFRIARCYAYLDDYKSASFFYTEHLKRRKRGLPSLYSLKEVKNDIKELELNQNLLKSYKKRNYLEAIATGKSLMRFKKNDHYTNAIVGICYEKINRLERALYFLKRSYSIEPNCPFVLWNYGNVLRLINRKKDAIRIWKRIIDTDYETKIPRECDEGNITEGLIVNTYYDIGVTYKELANTDHASDYLNMHMSKRRRGLPNLPPLVKIKKVLNSVNTK